MTKKYIFIVLILIILEIFVFNFQSLKSYILDYNEFTPIECMYYEYEEENLIKIDINNINEKVYNIYINYTNLSEVPYEETVIMEYTDESFSGLMRDYGNYRMLSHTMNSTNERSKYIQCDFIGDAKDIHLDILSNGPLEINEIKLNKKVPFEFNIIRLVILSLIICFLYSLLTRDFFKNEFDINNRKQNLVLFSVTTCFILLLCLIQSTIGNKAVWSYWLNTAYSVEFVDSIKEGRFDIDIEEETMEILKGLNNPYDISEFSQYDLKDAFDFAYYNGKAYLYYGIFPVLILLLPLNLITGQYLSIALGTLIFLALGAFFTVRLVAEIVYRYYKKTPLSLVILLSIFMLFNNKMLCLMSRPYVYEFVIAAGYCFVMAGLYTFLKYLRHNKKIYLFMSCTLMAVAVTCRPPTLFISLIIFIKILYDIIAKIRNNKIKETIPIIILSMIPYVVIGILLMIYNYIRFDNIFEFGANYQISVTDFRKLGININRILIGLTAYFTSPVNLIAEFPFVTSVNWIPEYIGYYYSMPIGGGYFQTSLLGIVLFFIPYLWKKIKEYNKEMSVLIIVSIILGILIAIFESNKCGSLGRYMADFIWLFNIVVVILILFIYDRIKLSEHKNLFMKILLIIILISCIINTLMIYSYENNLLKMPENIDIYYFIKYMICFWL